MSQIKFKFIEALGIVSPVYGALLQSGDKLTDVFSKLQGLSQMGAMFLLLCWGA